MKRSSVIGSVAIVGLLACGGTANVTVSAQASGTVAVASGGQSTAAIGVTPAAVGGSRVVQERRIDANTIQYLVSDAVGQDVSTAERVAMASAVVQAARELTDDTAERQRLATHVTTNISRFMTFASRAGGENALQSQEQDGANWKIGLHVSVDMGEVRRQLETDGVFRSNSQLADAIGSPTVMVLNREMMRDPTGENSPAGTIIDTSIQTFLTQQQWNLVDREALQAANSQRSALEGVTGMGTDPAAELAAIAGADMYIVYTIQLTDSGVVAATVSLTAHDTATAQQLGASIGRSRQYPGGANIADVVTEGVNNGMRDLLSNVRGYWNQSAREGRRYRLIVRGDLSDRSRQRSVRDSLRGLGRFVGDLNITANTISGVLVSRRDKDQIQDAIEDACTSAGFTNVQVGVSSRSLIMINAQ